MDHSKIKKVLSIGIKTVRKIIRDRVSLMSGLNLFVCPSLINIVLTR